MDMDTKYPLFFSEIFYPQPPIVFPWKTIELEEDAKAGLKVHVRASTDGLNYDTEDLYTFDIPVSAGQRVSKTVSMDARVMFIKIIVENLDSSYNISNVKVTATLGSP